MLKSTLILCCLVKALSISHTVVAPSNTTENRLETAFWRLKSVTIIHPGSPQREANAEKQSAKQVNKLGSPPPATENTTNYYLSPVVYPAGYYGLPRVRNFSETNPIQYHINPSSNGNLPSDPVHNLRLN